MRLSPVRVFASLLILNLALTAPEARALCSPEKAKALLKRIDPEIGEAYRAQNGRYGKLLDLSFEIDMAYADWKEARRALGAEKTVAERIRKGDLRLKRLKSELDAAEEKYVRLQRRRHGELEFLRKPDPVPNAAILKKLGTELLDLKDRLEAMRLEELKLLALRDFLPSAEKSKAETSLARLRADRARLEARR